MYTTLDQHIKESLKDPEFAKEYAKVDVIYSIAEQIILARKKQNMTQADLAEKVGTKQSVISRIEKANMSRPPSLSTLMRIAEALGKTLKIQLQ